MTTSPVDSITARLSAPASTETALSQRPLASNSAKPSEAIQFESFVLQSFVENMLPKNTESTFGSGAAGSSWRSMMAEKIAAEIAASGGIGIAKLLSSTEPVTMPRQQPTAISAADQSASRTGNAGAVSK